MQSDDNKVTSGYHAWYQLKWKIDFQTKYYPSRLLAAFES